MKIGGQFLLYNSGITKKPTDVKCWYFLFSQILTKENLLVRKISTYFLSINNDISSLAIKD
jgi:hypothetical protein